MMNLTRLKQISLEHRRKIVVIAGVVLIVLALAGYAFWSMNAWSTYKTSYESWQKELRTSIDAAIALPVTTVPERAKKMASFKDITHKIDTARQSLCRTSPLITWQHVIDSLRQSEEACQRIISGAEAFGKKLQIATTYLEKEQALAAVIATALAASDGKVTETTWNSQVTIWQDAGKSIAKISSTESSFNKVKTSATEKIKAVESAWQELIAAHTAKDKAKYLEARDKVTAAYEALLSLSTISTEQLTTLTASLQTSYSQVFSSNT